MPTTKYLAEGTSLQAVADAIRTKTGDSGQLEFPAGFVSAIEDIPSGGGGEPSVVFIDYDGTVVRSYTADEILEATSLPANPDHSTDDIPLVAQGWNWTLADIKAQLTAMPDQIVYVGQVYMPADEKTHIVIYIDPTTPTNGMTMQVRFRQSVAGGVTVDWGDGSATETYTGTSATNHEHTYPTTGWFDITLEVTSGTISFDGSNSTNGSSIFGSTANGFSYRRGRVRRIHLGKNINSIGNYSFIYCYGLKVITIPPGLTTLSQSLFQNCYSLSAIVVPNGVQSIGTSAFSPCDSLETIALPNSTTSLMANVFSGCTSLEKVTLPNSVTSIGTGIFTTCRSLRTICLPTRIDIVQSNMFNSCSGLKSVAIPSAVTSIGTNAFTGCTSLVSLEIPETVTSIGNSAFNACYTLKSLNIPNALTNMGMSVFYGCYTLNDISLPNSVTAIGNNLVRDCRTITFFAIPDTITNVVDSMFYNCYNLASVKIPEAATRIGNNAFYNCYSLTSITIPGNVTSVGTYAFFNCYGMCAFHFKPTTPPTLAGTNTFSNIATSDWVIYVPYSEDHSVLAAYQAATNWATYASRMVEEDPPSA